MEVRIKRLHKDAVIPKYAKHGDAGLDLTATSKVYDEDGNVCYGTGLAFEVPDGHVGLLFPRSSNAKKYLILSNSVGILDSKYRGEVFFKFKPSLVIFNDGYDKNEYELKEGVNTIEPPPVYAFDDYDIGDRIGQLIILPYPQIEFIEIDELSSTERGSGGYGSTNK